MSARRPAFTAEGRLVAPAAHAVPDLLAQDGTNLQAQLAEGAVSAVDLAAACLDRIEALNPIYNAVVSLRSRAAILQEAAEADGARRDGRPLGALHGLPIAIKDLAATKGLRTTHGSPLYADHVPGADDLAVARIRAAGALIVGKTNTPEFGLGSHTVNPVHGATGNAFDPALSAGGSSGGAAVALALRLLPIADGGDMGGSLRNPGAFNNVFGFRPSQGRVPSVPSGDPFYTQLATVGPMGRSVADLTLLLGVMAGYDERAPLSLGEPFRPADRTAPETPAPERPRVAWLGDLGGHLATEPGLLEICREALDELEPQGWTIEAVPPPFDPEALWRAFVTLRQFSTAGRYADLHADPAARAQMKPELLWEIEGGLALDGAAMMAAARVRGAFYQDLLPLLHAFDAVALPSAQLFAFPVAWRWPREIAGRTMDSYHRWMEIVVPGTMSGCPVANVPAGFDVKGRAMGLQLIGRPRADAALLGLCARYERDARREAR